MYFKDGFFDDKFCIGVNHMAKLIPCDIIVAKEKPLRFSDEILVVSEYAYGGYQHKKTIDADYYFKHHANQHEIIKFPDDPDWIVVSWSTVTSAIHIAAYLGFKNIFIAGHDCGIIDGKNNINNYRTEARGDFYDGWLKKIEAQTIKVRDWVTNVYDVNICSLNPFVSLNLEGHIYE